MNAADQSPLGQATTYATQYDPGLLFPIDRAPKRAELGIDGALPFHGVDIWNAYELSWLDARGKPQVAMAELRIPATSPRLVESKSLKLYLNSFAGERLSADELGVRVRRDLADAVGTEIDMHLLTADTFAHQQLTTADGVVIDDLAIDIDHYGPPCADFLHADKHARARHETLLSHLFKSNCPVTGQPDWASVQIGYTGAPIDHAGLLRYLVSFREHNAFHEQCVERIFTDIRTHCAPTQLTVYARFTRRGGLDINPFRSSAADAAVPRVRLARQ